MWGKVTLYNCYQLFVQFTSKKIKNPVGIADALAPEPDALAEQREHVETTRAAALKSKTIETAFTPGVPSGIALAKPRHRDRQGSWAPPPTTGRSSRDPRDARATAD